MKEERRACKRNVSSGVTVEARTAAKMMRIWA
jgi:hypothetical protein